MNTPKVLNRKTGPESAIQSAIVNYLRMREWFVKETHGNLYSSGFPDLFATHRRYGIRLIEVKNPLAYSFTPAQLENFPLFSANGCGVWVMVSATDTEYAKLWSPANWTTYLILMNQHSAH